MSYTYSKEDNEHVIWTLKNLEEKIGSTSMEIVETIAKKLDLKPERIEPLVQSALNRCVVFGEVKKKGTHFRLELLEQYTEYLQRQPSHEALGSKYSQKDLKREYGIALIVILVVELTAGGLVLGYRDKAEEKTREIFKSTIKRYYTTAEKSDGITLFWNQMMVQLKCCGVDNFHDFEGSQFLEEGNKTVPEACCVLIGDKADVNKLNPKDPRCPYKPSEANSYYMTGCYKTFINLLLDHANIAIAVGIGLGLIQLLGIFLAFCLCKSIDRYFK
ncbi:hypothetical protein RUM43_014780 [Polyplax serrata]|uniref:Tetraspanin n=1 Tax=Polyplax serrata TaxID=468196 RepID=A0AAN8P3Y2_POLSC